MSDADATGVSGANGSGGDEVDPGRRAGARPEATNTGPQTQLTQRSTPELWGRLVAEVFALPDVVEAHSQVSPASSRAVFLGDRHDHRAPETNLAPDGRLEPVHLHGVDDTSLHLVLPRERGAELTELGWAEPHQYGDFGTEFFVYGPRDAAELDVVLGFVRESLAFARGEDAASVGVSASVDTRVEADDASSDPAPDWSFTLTAQPAEPPSPEQIAALERASASLTRARAAYAAARDAPAEAESLIIAAHDAGASREALATRLDLAYTHVPALVSGERRLLPPIG